MFADHCLRAVGLKSVTGLVEKVYDPGESYAVWIFLMVYSENLLKFQHNTNVCFSDYAFPYIILVLSLVTLAVYMSASEIEVGNLFSLKTFLNRFDNWIGE